MSGRVGDEFQMKEIGGDISSAPSSRRHHSGRFPYIHKLGKPPKQNLLKEISTAVKETFFSDDPFRSFKDQPKSKKFMLGVQAVFPIFDWARDYSLAKFKGDLIAGLTIASLCIPQAYLCMWILAMQSLLICLLKMDYVNSSFVPPLVYAFMGSSRDIAIGPVAVVSLLLGDLLQAEIDPNDLIPYRRLAFTATFFAGLTQLALGFFRLGFLIEFLSHAAIVGFMGGAAITIALQQLKGLLGIKKNFTKKTDIVSVLRSVFNSAHHGWNWQTIVIGVTFLAFLLVAKHIGKRNKKYFWVPAVAPMVSVVVSTFCVYITRADKDGVQIVNHIEKGINPASANDLFLSGEHEAIAIGRTFAAMKSYQIDGNKEMVALGTMNIIGSLTSCYVATGSFSRSAVNYMSGCHTAVSNIVMAGVVFLTLELITPLFKYTPNAILASIIIAAVVNLLDYEAAILIWKIDKFDFVACMGAFFGVVFISVEIGLLIAVSLSLAKILLQVTRPRTAVLGKLPRTSVYRNTLQYPEARQVPGVLIIRVDSAIYFTNSNYIKERILRWLTEEEERVDECHLPKIQHLIVEMSPVTDIDTSGIHALEELYKNLQKREIQLALANPGTIVMDKLYQSEFADEIGESNIFLSVGDAIHTFAPKTSITEEP
ncbi:hypothetical protein G4B88_000148 [Cannabis sativa]|uniref:STAS domain-containing protein n=1 Tax=Cannabis sativa TaxID=3483 RepID=A0A7J6GKW3_CANSA|nr:hypothetical protein G4B88_000148 [Cannabis sativa]